MRWILAATLAALALDAVVGHAAGRIAADLLTRVAEVLPG